jgi:hypothetical protein
MNFPVYIFGIHPHLLLESLAYFIGLRVYLYTRNKDRIPLEKVSVASMAKVQLMVRNCLHTVRNRWLILNQTRKPM